MKLPGATDSLVDAVLDANPNTVVVVQYGTPVEVPWISKSKAKSKAVVDAWYGGNETGNGIADILFGDLNQLADFRCLFPPNLYGEDIYIGYRYYEVLFPFGHGLSYSTFEFSYLAVKVGPDNGTLTIKARVTNHHPSISRVIKAFSKVALAAGQSKTVEIKDTYEVLVGSSCADIKLSAQFETEKTIWWTGL
ncbi:glycoside hydrolase family 3 C-terminal domain-containing protein [Lipomyces starkeyi]